MRLPSGEDTAGMVTGPNRTTLPAETPFGQIAEQTLWELENNRIGRVRF
jgi:hypothetical protein